MEARAGIRRIWSHFSIWSAKAFASSATTNSVPGDPISQVMYRCGACANPLFKSDRKYHSGCGWPSFTEAVSPDAVELLEDRSHGMVRTEVRCSRCGSHLGHVFNDGPPEAGGERWCINSLSLDLDRTESKP